MSLLVLTAGCSPPQGGPPPPPPPELQVVNLDGGPAFPLEKHLESSDIAGDAMPFRELFRAGDELFHTTYNGYDGVGMLRLPTGAPFQRFSPLPAGAGFGGEISSQRCGACHRRTASGEADTNVLSDPDNDGAPPFNVRSTTSLFGNGFLQLLATELSEELLAVKESVGQEAAQSPGVRAERPLVAKGIDYGVIAATADADGNLEWDLSGRRGVDPDLIVRPLGWKGNVTTVRSNTLGAAAFLMGMQGEEFEWKLQARGLPYPDPDGDGVERELSVGDLTAMVVYGAAQETPQTVERLASMGLVAPLSSHQLERLEQGRKAFGQAGCDGCHIPQLHLENTVFEEPTDRAGGGYYDHFLAEKDPDYDPKRPVRFDLLTEAEAPQAETHPQGGAILRLYGDLKRHHMGRQLADPAGPQPAITANFAPLQFDGEIVMIQQTEFLTPELWGVGNTGPWLHDGRAATLEEAILWHGEAEPAPVGDPGRSEAQESREAYQALGEADQQALLSFLRGLRTHPMRPPGPPPGPPRRP